MRAGMGAKTHEAPHNVGICTGLKVEGGSPEHRAEVGLNEIHCGLRRSVVVEAAARDQESCLLIGKPPGPQSYRLASRDTRRNIQRS
jgi:hypothetical protein